MVLIWFFEDFRFLAIVFYCTYAPAEHAKENSDLSMKGSEFKYINLQYPRCTFSLICNWQGDVYGMQINPRRAHLMKIDRPNRINQFIPVIEVF